MGSIAYLDELTINQIAAGEVVAAPALALKELIENAVDAKALHLRIEAKAGGFQSLSVADDGEGIAKEDLILAVSRHATSKIRSLDDMLSLSTMGFRGEALASIAAISDFTMTSSHHSSDHAYALRCEGGGTPIIEPSAREKGTHIEIRRLFYNVPARKKFQKSVSASGAELARMVQNMAMTYPHVSIKYIYNGKTQFDITAIAQEDEKSLRERLQNCFDEEIVSECLWIDKKKSDIHMRGFLAPSHLSKGSRRSQHMVINHRYVSHPSFSKAVDQGYGETLASGRYAPFFLYFDVDPKEIDVNIHPQKSTVKIMQGQNHFSWIMHMVSLTLYRPSRSDSSEEPLSIDLQDDARGKKFIDESIFAQPIECREKTDNASQSHLFTLDHLDSEKAKLDVDQLEIGSPLFFWKNWAIWDWRHLSCKMLSLRLHIRDDISQEALVWLHLPRANARVFQYQLSHSKLRKKLVRQDLLIPYILKTTSFQTQELLIYFDALERLGMSVSQIGRSEIAVHSIVAGLQEEVLNDFFEQLLHGQSKPSKTEDCLETYIISAMAKSLESKRVNNYSDEEARELMKGVLLAVCSEQGGRNPLLSPRGKPVIASFTYEEIMKKFKN